MQHDIPLREAARAIFEAVYPGEDWAPMNFEEAERTGAVHYRQAVAAAQAARLRFARDYARQLGLF